MAKLDKKAKYDEFSIVDGKHCIGGSEIFLVWKSFTGWVWYATKINTLKKVPNTYYGYVEGHEAEWGSWYASDMEHPDIISVPKESWNNIASLACL